MRILVLLAFIQCTGIVFCQIPTNGLVAYYPFNGNAADESGNGVNGTVNGATISSDRFGNSSSAYSFNGIDNNILFNSFPMSITDNWTISAWISPEMMTQTHMAIELGYDPGYMPADGYGICIQEGCLFALYCGISLYNWNYCLQINSWHHIVMRRDNGILTYTVDNILLGMTINTSPTPPTAFYIGSGTGIRFFKGKIDDVRIYNRALMLDEIELLYYEALPAGELTITHVQQRTDGSGLVDIYYNLSGQGIYFVNMEASFNEGETFFPVNSSFITGEVGPIYPGNNKHIIWDGKMSNPGIYSSQSKLLLSAVRDPSPVMDIDGNIYQTVLIGQQLWMAENLKTTRYSNGINIEYPGADNSAWSNNLTRAYAWYDNDISWKDSYGALYNWYAVNNSNSICPSGWHVPTEAEWNSLSNYLGGVDIAGGKLKSTQTYPDFHPRWDSPNTDATNESGFSSLPGGNRDAGGTYGSIGQTSHYWSSTEERNANAWLWDLGYIYGYFYNTFYDKRGGLSVRCLKD